MTGRLRIEFARASPRDTAQVPAVVVILNEALEPAGPPRAMLMGGRLQLEVEPGLHAVIAHLPSGQRITATVQVQEQRPVDVRLDLGRLAPGPAWERVVALLDPGVAAAGEPHDWEQADEPHNDVLAGAYVRLWRESDRTGAWLPLNIEPDESWTSSAKAHWRFRPPGGRLLVQVGSRTAPSRFAAALPQELLDVSLFAEGDAMIVALSTGVDLADGIMAFLRRGALEHAALVCDTLADPDAAPPLTAAAVAYQLLRTNDLDRLSQWSARFADTLPWLPDAAIIDGWLRLQFARRGRVPFDAAAAYALQRFQDAMRWGGPIYSEGLRIVAEGVRLLQADRANPAGPAVTALAGAVEALVRAANPAALTTTYFAEQPDRPLWPPDADLAGAAGMDHTPTDRPSTIDIEIRRPSPPPLGIGRRLLLWCSASDPALIKNRVEYFRYAGIGLLLLVTSLVSGLLFVMTATAIFGGLSWGVVPVAVFWAAVTFLLDRSMVAEPSDGTVIRTGRRWSAYVLRTLIAVAASLIMTESALLLIFHDEIRAEVVVAQEQRVSQIARDTTQATDQRVATVGTQIAGNDKTLAAADAVVADAARRLQIELTGQGSTGAPGRGPYADILQRQLDAATLRRDQIAADVQVKNDALQDQITALRGAQDGAIQRQATTIRTDNGLITQTAALNGFLQDQPSWLISALPWMLEVLFLGIQLMPLSLKAGGRGSVYERRLRAQSATITYAAEQEVRAYQREVDLRGALVPQSRSSGLQRPRPITVLVLVDTNADRDAMFDAARSITGRSTNRVFLRHSTVFDLGAIGGVNALLIQRVPAATTDDEPLTASVVAEVAPDFLVLAGTCVGLRPDQRPGDIILGGAVQTVPDRRSAAPQVAQLVRHTASTLLLDRFVTAEPPGGARVTVGTLAVSPTVLNRERRLYEWAPDEIAAYEGDTAWFNDGLEWIMVRGVTSIAGREPSDDGREAAVVNTAVFVLSTIDSGALDATRWRPRADLTDAGRRTAQHSQQRPDHRTEER